MYNIGEKKLTIIINFNKYPLCPKYSKIKNKNEKII